METNKEYELCSEAILNYRNGLAPTLQVACQEIGAKFELANIMLGNEKQLAEEIVDENVRVTRNNICESCDQNVSNTCNQCACPISFITNLKFKNCPMEKW